MSLKIPPPNKVSEKQRAFITNLCLDMLKHLPDFDNMTFDEASSLIEELLFEKKQMYPDQGDSDKWGN